MKALKLEHNSRVSQACSQHTQNRNTHTHLSTFWSCLCAW